MHSVNMNYNNKDFCFTNSERYDFDLVLTDLLNQIDSICLDYFSQPFSVFHPNINICTFFFNMKLRFNNGLCWQQPNSHLL